MANKKRKKSKWVNPNIREHNRDAHIKAKSNDAKRNSSKVKDKSEFAMTSKAKQLQDKAKQEMAERKRKREARD